MLSPRLDMVAPSTCLTFQIMVLGIWLSLICQMFANVCFNVWPKFREGWKCVHQTNFCQCPSTYPTDYHNTALFTTVRDINLSDALRRNRVRMFTQHTVWQHRSRPYGMIFDKSLQSQVPCLTWDIIMKWVMLERRSEPFRNLLPVSEIFISVSFDKNSRKKEGR